MTFEQIRHLRQVIRQMSADGHSRSDIGLALHVSRSCIQRALMTDEQRARLCAASNERKERHRAKVMPESGDLLLQRLHEVFGAPRCEIAKELQGTRFA